MTSPKILDVDFADQDEVGWTVGNETIAAKPRERDKRQAVCFSTRVLLKRVRSLMREAR